eukprot:maker-scaffold_7-snap-gene-3.65-mRNA-1 protein AED:0.24 eAED:0.24 QI:0/1/0.5/1/1/1/2/964/819
METLTGSKVVVFGFKFAVASDEFWFHSLYLLFFRLCFLLLNIFFLLMFADLIIFEEECFYDLVEGDSNRIPFSYVSPELFFVTNAGTSFLFLIALAFVYVLSTKGDIFEKEKRKNINRPLAFLLFLYCIELGLFAWCVFLSTELQTAEGDDFSDSCSSQGLAKRVLLIVWAVFILVDILFALFLLYFLKDSAESIDFTSSQASAQYNFETNKWQNTCMFWCKTIRIMSCGVFGSIDSSSEHGGFAFQEVAEIFGRFFTGHNATPIDFFSALLLLRAEQIADKSEKILRAWNGISFAAQEQLTRSNTNPLHETLLDSDNNNTDAEQKFKDSKKTLRKIKKAVKKIPNLTAPAGGEPLSESEGDKMTLKVLSEYSKYQLAVYGWKLLVYMDVIQLKPWRNFGKLFGLKSVLSQSTRAFNRGRNNSQGEGGCCVSQDEKALLHLSNSVEENVIFSSFADKEGVVTPYYVFVDDEKKSVVVSCRGTLSLSDMLTDAMIVPTSLDWYGEQWGFDGKGHHAHFGMLRVANEIRYQLEETGVLHSLLNIPKQNRNIDDNRKKLGETIVVDARKKVEKKGVGSCEGYNLVVVGHSLGAGVASILSLLLKPDFSREEDHGVNFSKRSKLEVEDDIRGRFFCLAYAPPGCIFDAALCRETEQFIISPVIGNDLVPRLNWTNLRKLRIQCLEVLYRCRTNKKKILGSVIWNTNPEDLLYKEDEVPDTIARRDFLSIIEKLKNSLSSRSGRRPSLIDSVLMEPPGKLLLFRKIADQKKNRHWLCSCSCCITWNPHFEPQWISPILLSEFPISLRTLLDHFPNYYNDITQKF